MSALPVREQIIAHLDNLSEEQVTKVLTFIETIETPTYDPQTDPMLNGELLFDGSPNLGEEDDPLIGFFSGPPDLGERSEDILHEEFGIQKSSDAENK